MLPALTPASKLVLDLPTLRSLSQAMYANGHEWNTGRELGGLFQDGYEQF